MSVLIFVSFHQGKERVKKKIKGGEEEVLLDEKSSKKAKTPPADLGLNTYSFYSLLRIPEFENPN